MAEVSVKDAKLIQWLNEAYGKEKQLETALTAHIKMTEPAAYKKRLQQHLKETKDHGRQLERRIKKLGGTAEAVDLPGPDAIGDGLTAVANVAGRAVAQAQGAVQAVRGTSVQEKLLKNAKDELHEEAEEIANYTAIISLAQEVGDKDTEKIAKAILREEQRMYDFLSKQIPKLTKDVVKAEIPKEERASTSRSRSRSSSRSTSSRSSAARSSSSSRGSSSRRSSSRSRTSSNGSSGSSARSTARKAASTAGKTASAAGKTASTARKTAKTAAKSGSTAARKTAATARSSSKTAAKRTATTARKSASGSSSKAGSGSRSSGSSSRSRSSSSRKKS